MLPRWVRRWRGVCVAYKAKERGIYSFMELCLQDRVSINGLRLGEWTQSEIFYQGGCVDGGAFVLPSGRKKGV
jgi:hypothetical protein